MFSFDLDENSKVARTSFFSAFTSMYVPPTFRNVTFNEEITNLCDEFLHIDDTPEANIEEICVKCDCMRKKVTCICLISDHEGNCIFSKVYKNKHLLFSNTARHAEMFFISDVEVRKVLKYNCSITLFLTYQPCHYSGGHDRTNNISCTEALIHFSDKILRPLHCSLKIKFAYLYRAHWKDNNPKYEIMIKNSNTGLKMLLESFECEVMRYPDFEILKHHFNMQTMIEWQSGTYTELISKRKSMESFLQKYIDDVRKENEKD